ncbi:hypothetical protein MKX03_010790 [Papaver bracteatum]|nr:hypothetical protein MKX03_010790 [Papaver bracteatum]
MIQTSIFISRCYIMLLNYPKKTNLHHWNEMFEKLGTWGTSSNLVVYFTTVFNIKNVSDAILMNVFNETTFISPLIGGFLADAYLGRFKILGFASIASLMGLFLVMLTAIISKLHPPNCGMKESYLCAQPTASQWAFLLFALLLLVIGSGGIRPCNMAFGADQFNPKTDSGKKSIDSFINWYYCVISICFILSLTFIVYVQSNLSWALGLAIPLCLMFIACLLFFMGSRIYVKVKPEGSPSISMIQVLVAEAKKRSLEQPQDPETALFKHFTKNGSPANPWRLCTMQQVEEVKCLETVLPIWVSSAIFHIATTQQQTMHLGNNKFKIPAASYTAVSWLNIDVWIPICDRLIVRSLRKFTHQEGAQTHPTLGYTKGGGVVSSMPGLWLIPQLFLSGLAEAFGLIGQVEFYYKQFPENMRSIRVYVYYLAIAVWSYASGFLVSVLAEDLNKMRLDYFYYTISLIEIVNFVYFLVCAKWYRYNAMV